MPAPHLPGDDPQPLDTLVLSIVNEVTGRAKVRPADSFYDLGGTSLDAIRICLRVGRETGVEVGPETLLDSDDLADFIAHVAAARADR